MCGVIIMVLMAAGILYNIPELWATEPMVVWLLLPLCILGLIGVVWRAYRSYAAEQGMMDMRKPK